MLSTLYKTLSIVQHKVEATLTKSLNFKMWSFQAIPQHTYWMFIKYKTFEQHNCTLLQHIFAMSQWNKNAKSVAYKTEHAKHSLNIHTSWSYGHHTDFVRFSQRLHSVQTKPMKKKKKKTQPKQKLRPLFLKPRKRVSHPCRSTCYWTEWNKHSSR